jgi:hypothetical protein
VILGHFTVEYQVYATPDQAPTGARRPVEFLPGDVWSVQNRTPGSSRRPLHWQNADSTYFTSTPFTPSNHSAHCRRRGATSFQASCEDGSPVD